MNKIFYLAVLMVVFSLPATAQKNLIENGGFENETDNWVNYGASVTPYDFKSGKNSCVIIAADGGKWVGLHQVVSIPPKTKALEFSAWLKAINIIKGADEWSGGLINLEFLDSRQQRQGEAVNIARLTGDTEWEMADKIVAVPAGAVSFKILGALGYASGTLFIDDVVVRNAELHTVN